MGLVETVLGPEPLEFRRDCFGEDLRDPERDEEIDLLVCEMSGKFGCFPVDHTLIFSGCVAGTEDPDGMSQPGQFPGKMDQGALRAAQAPGQDRAGMKGGAVGEEYN